MLDSDAAHDAAGRAQHRGLHHAASRRFARRAAAGLALVGMAIPACAAWLALAMPGPDPCPRVAADPADLAARLRAHVEHLALALGPRSPEHSAARAAAAEYVAQQLGAHG